MSKQPSLDPVSYDAAIICAPIHVGRYPSALVQYLLKFKSALAEIPDAFVSVSLGIRSENEHERAEVHTCANKLLDSVGWQPDGIHHAAGALRYVEYDFFKRWMMRRIAKTAGDPIDTSRDHEMTDWKALDNFVDEFCNVITLTETV